MADEKTMGETVPGGKYIRGDQYVNADGDVIGEAGSGKTERSEPKVDAKADEPKTK